MTKFYKQLVSSDKTMVMGILNCTPDSFSDGGQFSSQEEVFRYALAMIDQGADIIDIGGESTRPGSDSVSHMEEIKRVVPVIKKIRKKNKEIYISIDTKKAEVARAALGAGANIVNDVSGLTDPKMVKVVREFACPVIIMHMKGIPKDMQEKPFYDDVVGEIEEFFVHQIEVCKQNGIEEIILDPGIGFGKRLEDNVEIFKNLGKFADLGYPVLMGASRKSFIEMIAGLKVEEREEATIAANVISIQNGVKIIRVHNVLGNKRAALIADALRSKRTN